MNLDDIKANKKTKQGEPSEYDTWRASVLSEYPNVFFPSLSAKKKKILKAVVQRLHSDTEYSWKDFIEWVVKSWPKLHDLTSIKEFSKYEYPELDLVLYNYDKLINLYITARTRFVPQQRKKKIDFSFMNER